MKLLFSARRLFSMSRRSPCAIRSNALGPSCSSAQLPADWPEISQNALNLLQRQIQSFFTEKILDLRLLSCRESGQTFAGALKLKTESEKYLLQFGWADGQFKLWQLRKND